MVACFFLSWQYGRVRVLAGLVTSGRFSRGTDTCADDLNAACYIADVQPTTKRATLRGNGPAMPSCLMV
jgi:hypothetical protein